MKYFVMTEKQTSSSFSLWRNKLWLMVALSYFMLMNTNTIIIHFSFLNVFQEIKNWNCGIVFETSKCFVNFETLTIVNGNVKTINHKIDKKKKPKKEPKTKKKKKKKRRKMVLKLGHKMSVLVCFALLVVLGLFWPESPKTQNEGKHNLFFSISQLSN